MEERYKQFKKTEQVHTYKNPLTGDTYLVTYYAKINKSEAASLPIDADIIFQDTQAPCDDLSKYTVSKLPGGLLIADTPMTSPCEFQNIVKIDGAKHLMLSPYYGSSWVRIKTPHSGNKRFIHFMHLNHKGLFATMLEHRIGCSLSLCQIDKTTYNRLLPQANAIKKRRNNPPKRRPQRVASFNRSTVISLIAKLSNAALATGNYFISTPKCNLFEQLILSIAACDNLQGRRVTNKVLRAFAVNWCSVKPGELSKLLSMFIPAESFKKIDERIHKALPRLFNPPNPLLTANQLKYSLKKKNKSKSEEKNYILQ